MKTGGRILAILVGATVTCYCGSSEKSPEQQPVASPAPTVQTPSQPAADQTPKPSTTVQPGAPPATAQPATPATATPRPAPQTVAPRQVPPTTAPLPTPPTTVQPPTPPAAVPPPPPPVSVPPPTPAATVQPPTPPAAIPAQSPPAVAILKGNPMGAVRFPHAAHTRLPGATCDLCHHASKPEKPLTSKFQKCQECHTKAATAPMTTRAQAAFHDPMARKGLCIDCHLKRNAAGAKAPAKCSDCHKKENG